jgi:MYXO-CTERM domain-containing protein
MGIILRRSRYEMQTLQDGVLHWIWARVSDKVRTGDLFMGKCARGFVVSCCFLLWVVGGVASAATYNFATFNETLANGPFSFTNNGGTSASISASAPVTFNFTAGTGLSTADHNATLTISTSGGPSTVTPATTLSNGLVDQPIGNITTLSLIEVGTGKNLLTVNFVGELVGRPGIPSAQISGTDSPGGVASFTSDFLNFTEPGNSYALSLASINPGLSVGAGGFLSSFTADVGGQFTGNAVAVPEPASFFLLGLAGLPLLRRRRV